MNILTDDEQSRLNCLYAYEDLAIRYHQEVHGDTDITKCEHFICQKGRLYRNEELKYVRPIRDKFDRLTFL
jgi:hypothetical protein